MLTIEDVAAVPLFSGLPPAELERLARTSADIHLAPWRLQPDTTPEAVGSGPPAPAPSPVGAACAMTRLRFPARSKIALQTRRAGAYGFRLMPRPSGCPRRMVSQIGPEARDGRSGTAESARWVLACVILNR